MNRVDRQSSIVEGPATLGRYRIRGVLGEGGMGRLYVAEQTGIEGFTKIVAVKKILPHLAHSEHFQRLFLNEARIAARLEHPNVVTTYELGEGGGTYFIAMEYLPGEDLQSILEHCRGNVPLPLSIAAYLAQQCANGLHYAHELRDALGRPVRLVHRDVNPSNIFVTYHGAVKLLDFGVVKAGSADNRTNPGLFKGKYAYSAPEQLDGVEVDPRTDVFSLGIVLWECLTGSRLFDSPSDARTIDALRSQTIAPPRASRPDIPEALDRIAMRALFRDPAHRYQSAAAMAEALEQYLSDDGHRITPKNVGHWLQGLFGTERAALKGIIARGGDIEAALSQLAHVEPRARRVSTGSGRLPTVRPRALWSTGDRATPMSNPRATSEGNTLELPPLAVPSPRRSTPARAPLFLAAAALVAAVAGFAATFVVARSNHRPAVPAAARSSGDLRVDSTPPGAHVFVDGDPSGLTTPATLRRLPAGRTLEVRLIKAGYLPITRRLTLGDGEGSALSVVLEEAVGTVRVDGMPARARLYLDDVPAGGHRPFTASVGPHRLRVEESSDVLFSGDIEVRPGEQTIRVHPHRRGR